MPGIMQPSLLHIVVDWPVCLCRELRPRQYTQQQLMYIERCCMNKLQSIAGPYGVRVVFRFNQQQRFEIIARGKPVRLNDILNSFEDKFGQPAIVERTVQMPCGTLCPVPLGTLPFPNHLLQFARGQLQVGLWLVLCCLTKAWMLCVPSQLVGNHHD